MVDLSTFLTVGGLAGLLAVILQFTKGNLPDNLKVWIPWLAVGLGIVLAEMFGLATGVSSANGLVSLGVTGLLAGITSSGLYQASWQIINGPSPKATSTDQPTH